MMYGLWLKMIWDNAEYFNKWTLYIPYNIRLTDDTSFKTRVSSCSQTFDTRCGDWFEIPILYVLRSDWHTWEQGWLRYMYVAKLRTIISVKLTYIISVVCLSLTNKVTKRGDPDISILHERQTNLPLCCCGLVHIWRVVT